MRLRKRHQLNELKKLLRDNSFATEGERVAVWRQRVKRSRPRYYALLPLALAELETDSSSQDDPTDESNSSQYDAQ